MKVISFTSALPGEGKTLTAVNLALTAARANPDRRILLIDADLRRSRRRPDARDPEQARPRRAARGRRGDQGRGPPLQVDPARGDPGRVEPGGAGAAARQRADEAPDEDGAGELRRDLRRPPADAAVRRRGDPRRPVGRGADGDPRERDPVQAGERRRSSSSRGRRSSGACSTGPRSPRRRTASTTARSSGRREVSQGRGRAVGPRPLGEVCSGGWVRRTGVAGRETMLRVFHHYFSGRKLALFTAESAGISLACLTGAAIVASVVAKGHAAVGWSTALALAVRARDPVRGRVPVRDVRDRSLRPPGRAAKIAPSGNRILKAAGVAVAVVGLVSLAAPFQAPAGALIGGALGAFAGSIAVRGALRAVVGAPSPVLIIGDGVKAQHGEAGDRGGRRGLLHGRRRWSTRSTWPSRSTELAASG